VAKGFFKDGLKVAFADNSPHLMELRCLCEVVNINHLSNEWFALQMTQFLYRPEDFETMTFKIENYMSLEEIQQ